MEKHNNALPIYISSSLNRCYFEYINIKLSVSKSTDILVVMQYLFYFTFGQHFHYYCINWLENKQKRKTKKEHFGIRERTCTSNMTSEHCTVKHKAAWWILKTNSLGLPSSTFGDKRQPQTLTVSRHIRKVFVVYIFFHYLSTSIIKKPLRFRHWIFVFKWTIQFYKHCGNSVQH